MSSPPSPSSTPAAARLASSVTLAHGRLTALRLSSPGTVLATPLLRSRAWLEPLLSSPVFIKLESEQVTGSFKVRGALNAISLLPSSPTPTVVTASTGNHALATAHALTALSTPARGRIFLPENASPAKLALLKTYPAVDLTFVPGSDCVAAETAAGAFARETPGAVYVSPCDNWDVMAGNGTIAIEILDAIAHASGRLPEKGTVYLTVGGGGMCAGVAAAVAARAPGWEVVGCQPQASAVMYRSVQEGKVVHIESFPTLSDGSAGGLEDDCLPFTFCSDPKLVHRWVTLSEEEIAHSIDAFCREHHKIIEGAAACAVAAAIKDTRRPHGKPVAIIACGANIAHDTLVKVLNGQKVY